jgi:thymidylate kinase
VDLGFSHHPARTLARLPRCPRGLLETLEACGAEVERLTDHSPRYHVRLRSPEGPLFAWYAVNPEAPAVLRHELDVRAALGRTGLLRGPPVLAHGENWRVEFMIESDPRTGPAALQAIVDASKAISTAHLPPVPGPRERRRRPSDRVRELERRVRLTLSPLKVRDLVTMRRIVRDSPLPRVTNHGSYQPVHIFLSDGAVWVIDWEGMGKRPQGFDLMQLWSSLEDPHDRDFVLEAALDWVGPSNRSALLDLRFAALVGRIASKLAELPEFGDRDREAARRLLELLPEARASRRPAPRDATAFTTAAAVKDLLTQIRLACGRDALLYHGPELRGRDVDLVVRDACLPAVVAVLGAAGLRPARGRRGHIVWSDPSGALPPVDLLPAPEWPAYYPDLEGIAYRAHDHWPLAVPSPEDRLLMLGGDALAGRPLDRVLRRVRLLGVGPDVRARVERLAAAEDAVALGRAALDLAEVAAGARGRSPLLRAFTLAPRSSYARRALLERFLRRVRGLTDGRQRVASNRPLLVTVSGMDGSGKSTVTTALADHLAERGVPAVRVWARLGAERAVLNRLALPAKRLIRPAGRIADPIAAGKPPPGGGEGTGPPARSGGPVVWTWILIVAMVNARSHRAAAARRSHGVTVVCDRWLADSLCDLRLRYGRHLVAEWLLRRLVPAADVSLMLHIDAHIAALRKPGDKADRTLERMEGCYATRARQLRLTHIDARLPADEVLRRAVTLVDGVLAERSLA